ncbi:glutamate-5-semialdehyde dehydrogenase [Candidatus Woesearchaeota archaeon]|nr:glutamate-5-semialdehyde dehydrogenase [Candidatus Woesearchaeota archaeon]
MKNIKDKAKEVQNASMLMATLSSDDKNNGLKAIAKALDIEREKLKQENSRDIELAKKQKIGEALLKRLVFDDEKINQLIAGINELAAMDDPIGLTLKSTELDTGLELFCQSCPIGVIGVIFEARPDALVQISCLCLKSSNSVILKGGKEAASTNKALFDLIRRSTESYSVPRGWIQLLETRDDVKKMLAMDEYIDLIIPRGSNKFVRYVMDNTRIPVLGHADGICHVYVDDEADLDMAVKVCYDSKCQYAAVCNAMETLLVHTKIASEFLDKLKDVLGVCNVKLLGDDKTRKILSIPQAGEKDWSTEYNDLMLSIKVVEDIDEAIMHINRYGSRHTDVIVTKTRAKARKFMLRVDSANVFWNCSTRFSDGYRYGLGAEVGISTSKIHARGPVGLEGLAIYKWKLIGNGHIVADYAGEQPKKKFTHKQLSKNFPLEEE